VKRLFGLGAVMLVLVGAAAFTPAASASIVVGKSIDGVKLGDTQARVLQVLGQPDSREHGWDYLRGLEGRVSFDSHKRVGGIWTGSRQQKTSKGIGPGSSLAKLKRAYPRIRCETGPFGPQSLMCVIRSRLHGRKVETSFPFFTEAMGVREVDLDLL